MLNIPAPQTGPKIAEWPSREVLLAWITSFVRDLRIQHGKTDDGTRAARATFTFQGEPVEVEAIAADDAADPEDVIVRRVAWVVRRRLGIHTRYDDERRKRLERDVIEASMRGDTAAADKIGLELVTMNETANGRAPLHTRFER